MAAEQLMYGDASWARIVPCTLTAGQNVEIASFGTKIDLLYGVKAIPTFPSATSANTTAKYHTTNYHNGNRMSTPDVSTNINAFTGAYISDEEQGATYKVDVEVLLPPAQVSLLREAAELGTPVILSTELGRDTSTQAVAGFAFILGKIADFTVNAQAGPHTYTFSVIGSATNTFVADTDEVDYNAAATGAANTITPKEKTAITIPAITTANFTTLKQGKIAVVMAS